jgi:alpha-L-rhamnosidase
MKKCCLFFVLTQCIASITFSQLQVSARWCENKINPVGVDVQTPLLSWQITGPGRAILQTAYEVGVATTPSDAQTGKALVWSSGKVSSNQSMYVKYAGSPLLSGAHYYWRVRVWDNHSKASSWSAISSWQMGLLHAKDWKAQWIEPGYIEDSLLRPSPLMRKEFSTNKKIQSATAYITAHGLYDASINGKRIGDAFLTPGWTSYGKRLQYQQYDVTKLLQQGTNAIGVMLGSGWYRGYLAWDDNKNIWGKKSGLLFQLEITYSDGTKQTVVSDNTWKCSTGSIVSAEIYNGETIDANKEKEGWLKAGYDDSQWSQVLPATYNNSNLIAEYNEPVGKHETFKPIQSITTPSGEKVLDFGQNLVGWVQVKLHGNKGDTIRIYHAEVLDKAGNFYTANLRAAKATATYILNGTADQYFEPHFTFYGFRYIKITGLKEPVKPEDFTAVTLYSDMAKTGSFTSSNALINQLQHNIQWGQQGNFLDVPTDCPQRDERLGWTGDAQVFSRTATFNRNVHCFFTKWLKDVAADQYSNGSVPHVIPNVLGPNSGGSTGWSDVSTIIPWNVFLAYGDTAVLQQQYPSMKAWVKYMQDSSTNDLWNTGYHFGDWLFYHPSDDNDGSAAITDKYLIAQCFYAHSTQLLINAAQVLGKADDVNMYTDLLQRIKAAFLKEYVTPSGRLVSGSQTAYVLALNFDMLPEVLRKQAADRLVENVYDYDTHLTTGFLGTPYLCDVLTRFGHGDVAFKLLMQTTYPSWLYPVKMGATTIWERWDGEKPDSTFETPGMNSFNHYAYGAIGDWMYRAIAGRVS